MKQGGGLHLTRPCWWPLTERPRATLGGLLAAHVPHLSRQDDVPSCLRTSPPFDGLPGVSRSQGMPTACLWYLGSKVLRCRTLASSPKAALALGCSLTPRLGTSFGRVTCMARAATVPGEWTPGFLLFCGGHAWFWGSSSPGFS